MHPLNLLLTFLCVLLIKQSFNLSSLLDTAWWSILQPPNLVLKILRIVLLIDLKLNPEYLNPEWKKKSLNECILK